MAAGRQGMPAILNRKYPDKTDCHIHSEQRGFLHDTIPRFIPQISKDYNRIVLHFRGGSEILGNEQLKAFAGLNIIKTNINVELR